MELKFNPNVKKNETILERSYSFEKVLKSDDLNTCNVKEKKDNNVSIKINPQPPKDAGNKLDFIG